MSDKTLLQAARDALAKIAKTPCKMLVNENGEELVCYWPNDAPYKVAKETLTRLDAELAKVAEPVVLDLRELKAWSDGDPEEGLVIKLNDLLAAIRAQLPGIEVRT